MTLFVVSDIHGFLDQFITALEGAGFEPGNPNHLLIGCGDYIDRGPQPWETIQYLSNIPNKILIRGNHEDLFQECCAREEAYMHDFNNGTAQSISSIAKQNPIGYGYFPEDCEYAFKRTKYFMNNLVNYFETKNYIFVHSWIPVISKDDKPGHCLYGRSFEFNPYWRDAVPHEWESARWGNPFDMAARGLLPDKTVIFGHWHSSAGWAQSEGHSEFGEDARFDPYYGDGFIAIDACTAFTKKVNILILEDELLETSF